MNSTTATSIFRQYLMLGLALIGLIAALPSRADAADRGVKPMQTQTLGGPATLAAGNGHTCTLTDIGTVKCWGGNGNGQLGDGSLTSSTTAVSVAGITGATALAAGGYHTCAIVTGGAVKCWGYNGYGQLGDGTTTQSPIPVAVTGISGAIALAAGRFHTCAITSGGAVQCWGSNGTGQLGNGTTVNSPTAVAVTGVSGAIAVAGGGNHTCAIISGGAVKCWGYNVFGQLGNGSTATSTTAVSVTGVSGATALATGFSHTCVIVGVGELECWGANGSGQLGNGSFDDSTTPTLVVGLSGATAVSAGSSHSCAIVSGGAMWCWGANASGQLGDDSTLVTSLPDLVTGLTGGATTLAAGASHTCATASGGAVQCWGWNYYGQVGNGITSNSSTTAVSVSGIASATELAAGDQHTCAIISGGIVRCWGFNGYGQLGDGTTQSSATAVAVLGASGAAELAAGASHTCAIIGGGVVKCWGRNNYGQLGDGSTTDSSTAVSVTGVVGATALAAGDTHTCAIVSGGTVKCWGYNGNGQLGNGSTTNSPIAVSVTGIVGATVLATSYYHTCVIISGGAVRCWGNNGNGQLGNGSTISSTTAVAVTGVSGAVALTAGQGHTCATISGGAVECWGYNGNGQLGNGTTTNSTTALLVTGVSDATRVGAGLSHTCAIISAGAMQCWGKNDNGQLGDGSLINATTAVTATGVSGATKLAAGAAHTCAILGAGAMQCWGSESYGQLGNGVTNYFSTPQNVIGSPFVTTFALTYTAGADGSLVGNASQTVAPGADGTPVTAVPNTGYHFVQWSDASPDNPRTDTQVNADISVEASFAIDQYTLTYTSGPNGSISGTTPQTIDYGADGTAVTAIAAFGYHFVKWSDDSTANPRTDTGVTSNISVTASFAIDQFTLTYTAGANGSISGTTPQTVNFGSNGAAVTAVGNSGYHFVQWSDSSTANPRTDSNVTADRSVSASFAINSYTVTATSGGHGSITPASQAINHGGQASFVVTPDAGYSVAVSGDTCSVNPSSGTTWISTAIEADCHVTATFIPIPRPVLQIYVSDDQSFARYGSQLNYVVTVTNTGSADAVNFSLSNSVPAQLDAGLTTWVCLVASSGGSCPASGSGDLNTAGITLPVGHTLFWLVSASVQPHAVGNTVEYSVATHLATGETVSASDTDTLVIFRSGFDAPNADDANALLPTLNACALDAPFSTFNDASVWEFLPLQKSTAMRPLQVVAKAFGSNAADLRIEQLNLDQTPRIRIVSIARNGAEHSSAWSNAREGAPLAIATIENGEGSRAVILVGAEALLELALPKPIAETLKFRASEAVNQHCR